ncbi:MAG: nucleoside triphosphate pyrophosphohydrolase [Patescibacteria group bacterium]
MPEYNKLVRDKLIDIITEKGERAIYHTAEDPEFKEKLREKLREEVEEFLEAESMEEMADILEVLHTWHMLLNWTREDVEAVQKAKRDERGGFAGRTILERTDI